MHSPARPPDTKIWLASPESGLLTPAENRAPTYNSSFYTHSLCISPLPQKTFLASLMRISPKPDIYSTTASQTCAPCSAKHSQTMKPFRCLDENHGCLSKESAEQRSNRLRRRVSAARCACKCAVQAHVYSKKRMYTASVCGVLAGNGAEFCICLCIVSCVWLVSLYI